MNYTVNWNLKVQNQQQGYLTRTASNAAFLSRQTCVNATRAGVALSDHPDAGQPVNTWVMDPQARLPVLPSLQPPEALCKGDDTDPQERSHAEHAPLGIDPGAICDIPNEILDRHLDQLYGRL